MLDDISLLPPSSYHITLKGIRDRYKCQSEKNIMNTLCQSIRNCVN